MLILLAFIFLSGVVTIFAPCIWPLLPIILSASASGGHRRPLGIVLGIMLSFTVFTLSLSYILKVIPFDPDSLRIVAVVIIGFLGVVLVVPALGARLEGFVSRLSGRFGGVTSSGSGFWGGFTTGFALGAVWSPCAGPILATVAALAATQAVNAYVVLITLVFVAGVGLPLFLFAFLSQRVLLRTRALSPYTGRIQQVFGVIMILAALMIYTGYDRVLQTKIVEAFPGYGNFLNTFEKSGRVSEGLDELLGRGKSVFDSAAQKNPFTDELEDYGMAPEFTGIEAWLNTGERALTLESLRGQVVLIDFWTYSCINCIRTFPYLTDWYAKYKEAGFTIVGVHTPEFEFEKKKSNVIEVMEHYGLKYPVAQDNAYATWNAYSNRYWPAHYLVDREGRVRYVHFGEGKYAETEAAIRTLLEEGGEKLQITPSKLEEKSPGFTLKLSPESYLGSARMERLASPERITGKPQVFTEPANLKRDELAFRGSWQVEKERAVALEGAVLEMRFQGKKVFLVMSPPTSEGMGTVKVFLDNELVNSDAAGSDVKEGVVTVESERLYELIDLGETAGEHLLRLEFETVGMAAYAFTFGS